MTEIISVRGVFFLAEIPQEGNRKCPLFRQLPETIPVARYHSLALAEDTLPDCLSIAARTADGEVMAVMHRELDIK